jgi:DNA-binding NarL/FixJ family response regulator
MIRIYHLEKYAIMREALLSLSELQAIFFNAGDGDDSKALFELLPALNVQVILLDIELERDNKQPIWDSIILCKSIKAAYPDINIVLHSPYRHAVWVEKLITAGVKGFVSKNSNFNKIKEAIQAVDAGKYYICPLIATQFSNLEEFLNDTSIPLKLINPVFSRREMEVLDLISNGLSNREIAEQLFLSVKTIETHRKNLTEKANVKNTAELIKFVSSRGLLLH